MLIVTPKNCDVSVKKAIQLLSSKLDYNASPTFAGLTLSDLTQGSVLFAGAGGVISQDNDKLFWDATNFRLGIGTTTPNLPLHVESALNNVAKFVSIDNRASIQVSDNDTNTYLGAEAGISWIGHGPAKAATNLNILVNGSVGIGETVPETLTEWTHVQPYLTLHNSTNEDTDGGRESRLIFKGEQSGGEETTLARIEVGHDGTGDDQKGYFDVFINDGDDGDSPTKIMRVDSDGITLSTISTIAAGLNVLRVTGLQTDNVAMTDTLRGAYIDVSNGALAATGTIRGMELKARTEAPGDTGNDVAVLEGLSIRADSKGHSVTTMRTAEFILDGKTGGTIGEAVGLRIANNLQADKATISYGLQIYRDSFDYTADIQLSYGTEIGESTFKIDNINQNVRVGGDTFNSDEGNKNIGIGYHAGYSNNTDDVTVGVDGTSNIYIGARAGAGETQLTGTITAVNGSDAIVGSGTAFTTELVVGDVIRIIELQGAYEVTVITDDTHLTISSNYTGSGVSGVPAYRERGANYGNENVAIGYLALSVNSTGYENTAVGDNTLKMNTIGHGNVALGNDALQGAEGTPITGSFNTGLGSDSLYVITSGSYNVSVGYQNLFTLTTGNYNVAVGYQSGYKQTTSSSDVMIGYQAGYNDNGDTTLVGRNVFIGYQCFYNDNGQYNIGFGYQAGYNNDTTGAGDQGLYNTYIGRQTGYGATGGTKNTGYWNTFIGSQSGYFNTSGFKNFFLGTFAGLYNTIGHSNSFLGTHAGYRNTTGSSNLFIGRSSGFGITGSGNVFLGAYTVASEVIATCNYNVIIGQASGNRITTGSSNIFLGRQSGSRQTTNSNLLIVDNDERADTTTELTNAIIYGVMAAIPANQTLRINAVCNVTENIQIDGTQVISNRVIDVRCDDALNSGDATTDGVIDALRDAMITHGLIAAT